MTIRVFACLVHLTMLIVIALVIDIAAAQDTPNPLIAEAESLKVQIDDMREEYRDLYTRLDTLTGEDSLITHRQASQVLFSAVDEVYKLADVITREEKEGLDTSSLRAYVDGLLPRIPDALRALTEEIEAQQSALRKRRRDATPDELGRIEAELDALDDRLDKIYEAGLRHVQQTERLGMAAAGARKDFAAKVQQRAELTAGRLQLAIEEKDRLRAQLGDHPDDPELQQRVTTADARVERYVRTLERAAGIMDELDLDTTQYRTLIVQATGEITRGLGNAKVAVGLISSWLDQARNWVVDSGPAVIVKVLVFLLIVLVFRVLSRIVRGALVRSIDSSKFQPSQLLRNMIASVTGNLVLVLGVLIALSQIGVSLGPLLAGLGVAGFIVGFALQETLGNFAAGLMILFYRPFDVGDFVEAAGVTGKVGSMSLVSTTILTFDNQTLIVPNGKIWGDVIRNVTAQTTRRVDMIFGISYSDDIAQAENVLNAILRESDKVLKEPAPNVRVHELADSSVNFVVRPWVKTEDYWDVYWHVTREVKMRFDAEGIGIPFPQRDVHLYTETAAPKVNDEPPREAA